MTDSKVKWVISLSNGETHYEDKGDFKIIEGELSPYQRLLSYIKENNLTITSLGLFDDKNRRWNLPSLGKNPKFRAFDTAEKPLGYRFFRIMGADVLNGGEKENIDNYTVIEAQFKNYNLQLWVRDEEPCESWVLVCEK